MLHALPTTDRTPLNGRVVKDMVEAGGGEVVRTQNAADLMVVGTGVRASDAVVTDAKRRGLPCAHAELLVDWLAYPHSLPTLQSCLLFDIPCSKELSARLERRNGWDVD